MDKATETLKQAEGLNHVLAFCVKRLVSLFIPPLRVYWNAKLRGQMHSGNFLVETDAKYPGLNDKYILHRLDTFYLHGLSCGTRFLGTIKVKRGSLDCEVADVRL